MVAVVWHYWIGAVLVVTAVVPSTIGLFALYLKKVQGPRYGGDE